MVRVKYVDESEKRTVLLSDPCIHLSVIDVDEAALSSADDVFDVVSVPVWDFDNDDDAAAADAAAAADEVAVSLVSDADGDLRILFALNGGIGSM